MKSFKKSCKTFSKCTRLQIWIMYFCSDKRKLLSYCKNRSVSQTLDRSRGDSRAEWKNTVLFSVKMSPTSVFGNVNFKEFQFLKMWFLQNFFENVNFCKISVFENVNFRGILFFENVNFVEFQSLKMWTVWNFSFWLCEFCRISVFEYVILVEFQFLTMWFW